MPATWLKSLHCKSRAYHDVIHLPSPTCHNSHQNLSDVIHPPIPKPKRSTSTNPFPSRVRRSVSAPITKSVPVPVSGPFFPSVSELQVGHPSRNVVEIIFHTRWSPKGFTGRIETVLKIQNLAHTLSSFEHYRDIVKSRVGSTNARCSADGNEMMRFRCLGPTSSTSAVFSGADWSDNKSGGGPTATSASTVCTYSGSGAAHESAGGGRGRRAMLVCRVIAGRVGSEEGKRVGSEFNSVSKENGELLVFDTRAVLPCFLVIYKL